MSVQSVADALDIRRSIISMLEQAGSGHAGGALGLADVFAVLYRNVLRHNPVDPTWSQRDRLLLSNGHTCPVLYAALAHHGYFPSTTLATLRQFGSPLQGHPHREPELGIEITAGPLGQGLSVGLGMALAAQRKHQEHHTFVVTSDGEHQEGQTWEAYLLGSKYQLDNVTVIIDRNYIQISGVTEHIMPLDPLADKIKSFGWQPYEVDGHDHDALERVLLTARDDHAPSVVIAYTQPGKGVDFIANKYSWHGSPPSPEEAKQALHQLNSLDGHLETQHD
jgi:transketolase